MTVQGGFKERDQSGIEWMEHAECRGMYAGNVDTDDHVFFPTRGDTADVRRAKAICMGCSVRLQCLDYALRNGEKFGIWGGMSERERRKVRSRNSQRRRGVA